MDLNSDDPLGSKDNFKAISDAVQGETAVIERSDQNRLGRLYRKRNSNYVYRVGKHLSE